MPLNPMSVRPIRCRADRGAPGAREALLGSLGPRLRRALLPLAVCGLAWTGAAPAQAAFVTGHTVQTGLDNYLGFNYAQQLTSGDAHAVSVGGASSFAQAQADLGTGTVRVGGTQTGAADAFFANALIGDSFQHRNGAQPFTWSPQTGASFQVHIDGHEDFNPGQGNGNPVVTNFALASLMIFRAGELNTSSCNAVFQFSWAIGANGPATDFCGNAVLAHLTGSVDADLTASFQPGADFDWLFVMRVGGGLSGANPDTVWTQDFANTATVRYMAPDGATVLSSSGAFPGTAAAAVPEPETLWLMLAGLGLVGARRRRDADAHRRTRRLGTCA
jgi:hypothetical protein